MATSEKLESEEYFTDEDELENKVDISNKWTEVNGKGTYKEEKFRTDTLTTYKKGNRYQKKGKTPNHPYLLPLRESRCVKCAGKHNTKERKIQRNTVASCALCNEKGQLANYTECIVYKNKPEELQPKKITAIQNLQQVHDKAQEPVNAIVTGDSKPQEIAMPSKSSYSAVVVKPKIRLDVRLKTREELAQQSRNLIEQLWSAAEEATPVAKQKPDSDINYPLEIRDKLKERKRTRRVWHNTRNVADKRRFNQKNNQTNRKIKMLRGIPLLFKPGS
ncbi:hypothetical protein HHI36_009693 [Cryptolaemus montrouzieri]|uniref:Uncharacterized protein n=1 Tax=Cryptolaemus montrouzieri TaxID=559131 RepID=A0ABD2MGK4_9CUCU